MIEMYRMSSWSDHLEKFEVIKTSDKSVWFKNHNKKERRELLITNDYCWFNSKIVALKWREDILRLDIQRAKNALNNSEEKLDKFYKLHEQTI